MFTGIHENLQNFLKPNRLENILWDYSRKDYPMNELSNEAQHWLICYANVKKFSAAKTLFQINFS